ncbi:MAG TPA: Ig-like domain-containing protein [Nocardioides sp.]|nr:Ig-like domain-containing protein [Nocardioides sp.]
MGTPGDDVLRGTPRDDVICGRGGDDRILGRGGDDVLRGGRGDDELVGGRGTDRLLGGPGRDTLEGVEHPAARDVLRCGAGRDAASADPSDRVGADCERVEQDHAPSDLVLEPSVVPENQSAGTVIGTLTVTDRDRGDAATYRLVDGAGSADNDRVSVTGDVVTTAEVLDHEARPTLAIRVRATDRSGLSVERALTVEVTDVEETPVTVDDTVTTREGMPVSWPLSGPASLAANDTDPDGDPLTVVAVAPADHGTTEIADGQLSYRPPGNLCGPSADSFGYTVGDGRGGTARGVVTVDITCVNDAPNAAEDALSTNEDVPTTVQASTLLGNDTDPEGDALSVTAVGQATHGTAALVGSAVTFTPDANFCGAASFEYTVADGQGGQDVGTVSVAVACVDDLPVARDDAVTVTEDAAASAVDVLGNDVDVEGDAITIGSVTQAAHGTVAITGGGTGLTYAPDPDYCNSGAGPDDTFTYTVNGGSTATVAVTVTCVDDDPIAVADAATVSEDSGASAVDVLVNDTDSDGGPSSVTSVTQPTNGTVVITGAGTGLTYEPDANYCNNPPGLVLDTFTYAVAPGGSSATVTVTVTCVDDAPVAVDDSATVALNSGANAVDVLGNDTDVDGGATAVESVTQPANGTVVITGGGSGLTYEPNPAYCNNPPGTSLETFTYTVNGGSTATVTVTVTCDTPPVAVDDNATVLEDSGATAVDVLANDTDSDGGPKSVASITPPAHGTVVITGGGTGLTYQPDADYCGPDSFTYTIAPGSSAATVSVTVTCVDDAPVAVDDDLTVAEDGTLVLDLLSNDTDIDGGPESAVLVTGPANGTLTLAADGTGTYHPNPNYCGTDSFTYKASNGTTQSSPATVTITVTCVNDAPVAGDETFTGASSAVGNTTYVVDAPGDGAPTQTGPKKSVSGNILAGDTDIDGPNTLAVVPGTATTHDGGSATLQPDGDFIYRPKAGTSCTDHSDYFDYTVTDGATPTAGTDTGRVTIDLAGCVWYVDNTASGDGSSTDPFGTLAEAQTASAAGDTVFVFKGDGTTTGYDTGFDLKSNQQLLGEIAGLQVGADLLYAAVPGARPQLTDSSADVVTLGSGATVRGLQLDPSGGGGIAGGAGVAGGTIADVRVIDTGTAGTRPGLELDGTTGAFAVSDLTVDNTGATTPPSTAVGVRLDNAGTVAFAGSGTVSIATKGAAGLAVTSTSLGADSVFDDITVTGSGSGGVSMTSTTGQTTFSALSLTTTSGATPAFQLSNAGNVTVTGSGTADISATGGPAVDVTGTPGVTLDLDTVTSTGSAGDGVNLAGLGSGTFRADELSTVTDAAGIDFDLDGGSGAVLFGGTITDDLGRLVRVQNTTGGTKTFTGAVTDGGDGDGSGIALAANTGATVRFDGGLTLATGPNAAFSATGGGTVAVTDPAGAASNTLTTTTGVALDVVGTTIGADGLTFERVSSNGAPVGIRLSGTGPSGSLTVTGAGGTCTNASTTGCTGGVIANGTGPDSSSATPAGTGIVLNDTRAPSFTRMWLHDFSNYAIRGTSVAGFTLATSVVNGTNGDNATTPYDDSAVLLANLSGSASIANTYVSGGYEDNVRVVNTTGALDRITFTNDTFGVDGARPTNDALSLETSSSAAQLKATVTGSTFSSAGGDLLQVNHGGAGVGDLVLTGNTFQDQHPAIATGGGGVSLFQSGVSGGDTTMDIENNTFRGAVGTGVLIVKSTGPASQTGTFANNTVGASGVADSGSLEGSALKIQQAGGGSSTWSVTGNTIYGYNNFGVEVLAGGGATAQSGGINTKITGNTIGQPGANPSIGIGRNGVHLNIGTVPGDSYQACAVIGGAGALANNLTGSGSSGGTDVRLRQRQATTIRLPGYGGANNDNTAVQTFVSGQNSGGATTLAANIATPPGPGGGFVGGTCPVTFP